MNLKSEMAKLMAQRARIEKSLARDGEYPCPGRAYLTKRAALLVSKLYDLESRIDETQAKAGIT